MATTLEGRFASHADAHKAILDITALGVEPKHISVLALQEARRDATAAGVSDATGFASAGGLLGGVRTGGLAAQTQTLIYARVSAEHAAKAEELLRVHGALNLGGNPATAPHAEVAAPHPTRNQEQPGDWEQTTPKDAPRRQP